jgi:mono/diheme cytochrome c family protein
MTRQPVHNAVPAPKLPFPLNIRLVLAGWNLLFFHEGRFRADPTRSAAWNRGAYIAEGLGHCAACHTWVPDRTRAVAAIPATLS